MSNKSNFPEQIFNIWLIKNLSYIRFVCSVLHPSFWSQSQFLTGKIPQWRPQKYCNDSQSPNSPEIYSGWDIISLPISPSLCLANCEANSDIWVALLRRRLPHFVSRLIVCLRTQAVAAGIPVSTSANN